MDKDTWLVADYFDEFRCKCGDCRHTCCGGWKIAVGEDEYFRIIGMDCSQRLHEKIEGAFVRPDFPTHDRYMLMEADWTGRCRMLDEDGKCMLQKECGEDAITEVCRVYPRSYRSENGRESACCSGSCEATVELLLRREQLRFRPESQSELSKGREVHPEISEHVEYDVISLFDTVVSMLQDRRRPLTDRIAAVAELTGAEVDRSGIRPAIRAKGLYDTILPILREFCEEAPSFSTLVDEFEQRYSRETFEERFAADRTLFEKRYPDWSCYFENMICNNLLYSAFPAVDERVDIHHAIFGLSLQYTLLRVICICHTAVGTGSNEGLVDAIAELYHVIEHTAFYYNAMILLK